MNSDPQKRDHPFDYSASREKEVIRDELTKIGLHGLVALVPYDEEDTVISYISPVVVLPVSLFEQSLIEGTVSQELIAVGLKETIRQLRPLGPTLTLGESLLSLALSTRHVENQESTMRLVVEAINTFKKLNASRRAARAIWAAGSFLMDGGQWIDALRAFDLAREQFSESGDEGGLSACSFNYGKVCRYLGLYVESLEYLRSAREILPKTRASRNWIREIQYEIVLNLFELGRNTEVLQMLNDGFFEHDSSQCENDSLENDYFAPFIRGEIFLNQENIPNALKNYIEAAKRAIKYVMSSKSVRFQRSQRSYVDQIIHKAILCAIRAKHFNIAFGLQQYSETGVFTRRYRFNIHKTQSTSIFDWELPIKKEIVKIVEKAKTALDANDAKGFCECNDRAEWLLAKRDLLYTENMEPPPIEDDAIESAIDRLQTALDGDSVFIQFVFLEYILSAFVVTDDRMIAINFNINKTELAVMRSSFWCECRGRFEVESLKVLENEIVSQLAPTLGKKRKIYFVPVAELFGLPLHALELNGTPICESHEVRYALNGLSLLEENNTNTKYTRNDLCTIIGVPSIEYIAASDLPAVKREVEFIETMFSGAQVLVDSSATSEKLFNISPETKILHIACHGQFRQEAPLLSSLFLADRPVYAFEIMMARYNLDLVVLSACETGEVRVYSGNYLQSLAYAFRLAGARTVISAMWPVNDTAAMEFTMKFYKGLLEGTSVWESAGSSMMCLRSKKDGGHVSYWAPFAVC